MSSNQAVIDLSPTMVNDEIVYVQRSKQDLQIIENLGMDPHHKGLGSLLGLVVAIAIPVFAPMVSSAIGLTGAIASKFAWVGTATKALRVGSTIGSALVGAATGAISAKVRGVSVSSGALVGAISGGVGGYFNAPAASALNKAGNPLVADLGANSPYIGPGVTDLATGPLIPPSVGYVGGPGHVSSLAGASSTIAGVGATSTASAAGGGVFAQTAASLGLTKAAIAQVTLQAGAQILGQKIFQGQMTDQQKRLLEMRKQELAQLKEKDDAAFRTQLSGAQELINNARYLDPTNAGVNSANAQSIAHARGNQQARQRASLSGRGYSTSDIRRANVDRSRAVASAYDSGFSGGVQRQSSALQAGLNSIPSGSTTYSDQLAALQKQYDSIDRNNTAQATNFAKLAGGLFPVPPVEQEATP